MDGSSMFLTGSGHRISSSSSTTSLDIGQLTGTTVVHSLLSESVTLSSLSSKSSDALLAFPCRSLPKFSTIPLGEHLKMFSSALPPNGEKPDCRVKSFVLVAAPTSPRLKSMCKECLSINKWAEHSAGWKAPGHIPWETIQDGRSINWVPEGSLFSPDTFFRALADARAGNGGLHSSLELPTGDASPERKSYLATNTSPTTRNDALDLELVDTVRELKDLRSFFQEMLQSDLDSEEVPARPKSTVPALVVSTSQLTFPLALDSCLNLAPPNASVIACRRGKKAPPPLKLPKDDVTSDIAYPDIPTAFLGSSTPEELKSPGFGASRDTNHQSVLNVEDMINNLRLQCSTMSLRSPSIDASWNSRSALEPQGTAAPQRKQGKAKGDEWAFANALLKDYKPTVPTAAPTSPTKRRLSEPAHRGPPGQLSPINKGTRMRLSERPPGLQRPHLSKAVRSSNTIASTASAKVSRRPSDVSRPIALRSAMAKGVDDHQRKPFKTVRFALPQSEVERDLIASSRPPASKREIQSMPTRMGKIRGSIQTKSPSLSARISRSSSVRVATPPSNTRTKSKEPMAPGTTAMLNRRPTPNLPKVRAHSIAISSPLRQISINKGTISAMVNPIPEVDSPTPPIRRSNTLGRHSLSRIIRGPMFGLRENKRATIAVDTAPEVRREKTAVKSEHLVESPSVKKNRMPVQLRNILTRFK